MISTIDHRSSEPRHQAAMKWLSRSISACAARSLWETVQDSSVLQQGVPLHVCHFLFHPDKNQNHAAAGARQKSKLKFCSHHLEMQVKTWPCGTAPLLRLFVEWTAQERECHLLPQSHPQCEGVAVPQCTGQATSAQTCCIGRSQMTCTKCAAAKEISWSCGIEMHYFTCS